MPNSYSERPRYLDLHRADACNPVVFEISFLKTELRSAGDLYPALKQMASYNRTGV